MPCGSRLSSFSSSSSSGVYVCVFVLERNREMGRAHELHYKTTAGTNSRCPTATNSRELYFLLLLILCLLITATQKMEVRVVGGTLLVYLDC